VHGEAPAFAGGEQRYWLLPFVWSSLIAARPAQAVLSADEGTPSPIGQDTPVEWLGQYPPGFLGGSCFDPILIDASGSDADARPL
jgi:hypothetical protein